MDCGGSCQACWKLKYKILEIISFNSFFLGNGKYDAMAQVKNLNPAHGAKLFNYRFKFYNSAKEQIGKIRHGIHFSESDEIYYRKQY